MYDRANGLADERKQYMQCFEYIMKEKNSGICTYLLVTDEHFL